MYDLDNIKKALYIRYKWWIWILQSLTIAKGVVEM